MKTRDTVIGLIVLVILITGALWIRKARIEKAEKLQLTTPTTEEKIANSFNNLEIPEDVTKIELKDVSGGDGFGIATADTVLVDLPDPEAGTFYQVWVEEGGNLTPVGRMRVAKGGYLLEGNISGKVVVSRESVNDNKVETKILEGSF